MFVDFGLYRSRKEAPFDTVVHAFTDSNLQGKITNSLIHILYQVEMKQSAHQKSANVRLIQSKSVLVFLLRLISSLCHSTITPVERTILCTGKLLSFRGEVLWSNVIPFDLKNFCLRGQS
mmetsp:Transcript_8229/g.20369  ORF Transcript_8229/g.20369 Transcript_8229/m.20369 type:complete len:120 (+) Transcript_8229:267-626(+)